MTRIWAAIARLSQNNSFVGHPLSIARRITPGPIARRSNNSTTTMVHPTTGPLHRKPEAYLPAGLETEKVCLRWAVARRRRAEHFLVTWGLQLYKLGSSSPDVRP